jgi:hypothetical protein
VKQERIGGLMQMVSEERMAELVAKEKILQGMVRGTWVPSGDRKPAPFYTVPLWVTGGRLHHGEDFLDAGVWNDRESRWQVSVGLEDEVAIVSHWLDVDPPTSMAAVPVTPAAAVGTAADDSLGKAAVLQLAWVVSMLAQRMGGAFPQDVLAAADAVIAAGGFAPSNGVIGDVFRTYLELWYPTPAFPREVRQMEPDAQSA